MLIRGATRPWPEEPGQIACYSKDMTTRSESDVLSAHHLRIEPGGEFRPHSHEIETELHFVISGCGQALEGDRWEQVTAGDVVLDPPGVEHGFRNTSSKPLFILCIFTPPLY